MNDIVTHVGYSDESNWNKGRYRSLGLVTLPLEASQQTNEDLQTILSESGVTEFKWKKLRGARERFAAKKLISYIIKRAVEGALRVDVLIWDTQDARHSVAGRDDIANLQRMYFHLFRNVMGRRWPDDAIWRFYPDEQTSIDWESVRVFLARASSRFEPEINIFHNQPFRWILRRYFHIEQIIEGISAKQPLLQLADLFAGMAVFSYTKYAAYEAWLHTVSPTQPLFPVENGIGNTFSNGDIEKFTILKYFGQECKKHKLGVSLKSNRGLRTPNPANPINFWLYQPQHPMDRAPTRNA